MGQERPNRNTKVDTSYLEMVAQGLIDDFALRYRSREAIPKKYYVNWLGLANDNYLEISFKRFRRIQRVLISNDRIVYEEKSRKSLEQHVNNIYAVEKAEEFMKSFGNPTDPYDLI